MLVESTIGIADPRIAPTARGKETQRLFVIERGQTQLLEVVARLQLRRAASRADCTAGNNNPMRIPMMAITTSSSTSVKPNLGFGIWNFPIWRRAVRCIFS